MQIKSLGPGRARAQSRTELQFARCLKAALARFSASGLVASSSVAVETLPKCPDANAERVRLAEPNTRKTQQTKCLGMKSIDSVCAPAFGRSTDESTSLPQTQSMSNPAARRLQSSDPSRAPTAENLARGQSLIFWGRAGPASARVIAFAFVLRSCFVFFVFAWVLCVVPFVVFCVPLVGTTRTQPTLPLPLPPKPRVHHTFVCVRTRQRTCQAALTLDVTSCVVIV